MNVVKKITADTAQTWAFVDHAVDVFLQHVDFGERTHCEVTATRIWKKGQYVIDLQVKAGCSPNGLTPASFWLKDASMFVDKYQQPDTVIRIDDQLYILPRG